MNLNDILNPIQDDLQKVSLELDDMVKALDSSPSERVFRNYFKKPGKYLRPSLLLLSAAAADEQAYLELRPILVKAAAAIELVHNASLIHDDIVDEEMTRRGQKTLNNEYGNKIAAMAGNALFIKAIIIMLEELPNDAANRTIRTIRKMSEAEILQLNRGHVTTVKNDYIELIKGKTALLMAHSCALGARIIGGSEDTISAFEKFGLNFGMTYQIIDDSIDKDYNAIQYVTIEDVREYAGTAAASLSIKKETTYSRALFQMLEYIMSSTHIDVETLIKH